jgi:predicted component of type VI protein secretion system
MRVIGIFAARNFRPTGLLISLFAVPLLSLPLSGSPKDPAHFQQIYSNLTGQVVLDNERVLVQKFTIQPGQATGSHIHPGDQLLVFIKGGVLTSKATGRATLWRDGRVVWQDATERADEGSTNTGPTPIELLWVTLKTVAKSAAGRDGKPEYGYLNYPNIPGEDVLENDQVIVQRFVMNPGQWEGVHAHRPNTFYIFIKGGRWISRTKKLPQSASGDSPDGTVGWMPATDISEGHESGNVGPNPSDVVWIALKK